MYRMYGHRAFDVATVSINYPDEKIPANATLQKLHATTRNYILGSNELYDLLAAFDADWNAAVPYTMLIGPNGEVVDEGVTRLHGSLLVRGAPSMGRAPRSGNRLAAAYLAAGDPCW